MKKNIAIFDSVSDHYGSAKICRLISEILSEDHNVLKFTRFNYSNSDFKKIRFPLLVNRDFRERPIYFFFNIIKDFLYFLPNFIRIGRETDLIYCNTFGTIIVGIMYSILLQKKVILHLHESSSGSKFAKSIVSLLAPLFLHVICVSAFTKSDWGLSDCPNVKVIKNKLPFNVVKLNQIRQFDFCFVGRLTEKKGFDFFKSVLYDIDLKIHSNITVAIAGGSIATVGGISSVAMVPSTSDFKNINIVYFGEVENRKALSIFSQSKIALIPSVYNDPYPTVSLEAQSMGCTPLVSDRGGLPETVVDDNFVMDKFDTNIWSKKIIDLLDVYTPIESHTLIKVYKEKFCFTHFRVSIKELV